MISIAALGDLTAKNKELTSGGIVYALTLRGRVSTVFMFESYCLEFVAYKSELLSLERYISTPYPCEPCLER